ncbi:hypothetical protein DFH09DRAFT_1319074 [Mycena vulgaris]|nr:hypothetical protein DFH09DRAFT_1319074 [Mycena vulgaris]
MLRVYTPAESMEENAKFWDVMTDLWMTTDLPVPDSMGGGTNVVEEPIDRLPHRRDSEVATTVLARFKRLLGLQDGWRITNPDTKQYTYTSAHQTHSRLDRIYVSPALMKNCRAWEISDAAGGLTDHSLVSVRISAPGSPYIGKGRYTIPIFLLRDKAFVDFTVNAGQALEAAMNAAPEDAVTIQVGFKAFKDSIRNFARARAKVAIGTLEQKKRKLQSDREMLLNHPRDIPTENEPVPPEPPDEQPTPVEKVAAIQHSINDIVEQQQLDKITKFSVCMSKDTKPRDTISFLQRTDTTPPHSSRRSDEMAEIARDYHNDLQHDASTDDRTAKDAALADVLQGMSTHGDDPEMCCLATLLTEDNILEALLQSASGTASGDTMVLGVRWNDNYEAEIKV